MSEIVTGPTAAAQWQQLVQCAAAECEQRLEEELESYLVFLLMRFASKPQFADTVLALEYLHSAMEEGRQQADRLRDVGDQCLLYAGLFPLRARRRMVRVRYYVDLGRSAYRQLAERVQQGWAQTFDRLADEFVGLRDVLQAMRELDRPAELDSLALHELWQQCGSRRAGNQLQVRYPGTFAADGGEARH